MISPNLMPLYAAGVVFLLLYPDAANLIVGLILGLITWRHF